MKFVVILKAERNAFATAGDVTGFVWEVRELLRGTDAENLLERTGPTLAAGRDETSVLARAAAEAAADKLAEEDIYVYDTNAA